MHFINIIELYLGLSSLYGEMNFSRNLVATRYWFRFVWSLWNLTGFSKAVLPPITFRSEKPIILDNTAVPGHHETPPRDILSLSE